MGVSGLVGKLVKIRIHERSFSDEICCDFREGRKTRVRKLKGVTCYETDLSFVWRVSNDLTRFLLEIEVDIYIPYSLMGHI